MNLWNRNWKLFDIKTLITFIFRIMIRFSTIFKLLLIFCLSILYACTGPKSLTKKGNKLSQAGLHQEAINYYIDALSKKNTHIDAIIGLKNSSTIVLNEFSSQFFKAFSTNDNKTAVYTYLEMVKFVDLANRYNAKLSLPSTYEQDYKSAKEEYLKSRFEDANRLISEDKFNDALCVFEEIETIDPNFKEKDFETLKEMSQLEPHYRRGNKEFNNNQFRNAYTEYKIIFDQNPKYKDVKYKLEDALQNAQFNIGVLKFENLSKESGLSEYLSGSITNDIISSNNPFIKLIDRSNVNLLKNEQNLNLKGLTDGKSNVKAGELIGAHAFLTGKVLSYSKSTYSPRPQTVRAYESYSVKKYDAVKKRNYYETEYRKVRYQEYSASNEVYISFQIQLVSAETGQILMSEVINKQTKSEVNYATYNGNHNNLVPGNWVSEYTNSPQDRIFTNNSDKRALQSKFTATKQLRSVAELKSEAQQNIANVVVQKIIEFNPETKKND